MTLDTRAARWVALFCLCLTPVACRQGDDMPVATEPIPFYLVFSPGNTYQYDAVLVNEYGYYLPSTRSRAIQRITQTGGTLDGFSGVSTVLDSTVLLRDTTAAVQEFFLAQSPGGDLYRFGLLAEIARMIRLPVPPKRWDRIAGFSLGFGQPWMVGYLDSAQHKAVYGNFVGVGEMFSARVNGVQNVFSCYRVDLAGEGLEYSFWVSDSPPAFLRYILEPGDSTKGAEYTLTDVSLQ
jgi:hypothetical protein